MLKLLESTSILTRSRHFSKLAQSKLLENNFSTSAAVTTVMGTDDDSDNDDNDDDEFFDRCLKVSLVLLLLKLSLSSSLSYPCSKTVPNLTPLFSADPLHPRGGLNYNTVQEHFNDNDDDNDTSQLS